VGDDAVQESSDYNDSDESDNVLEENSMQVATQDFKDDTDQVENV